MRQFVAARWLYGGAAMIVRRRGYTRVYCPREATGGAPFHRDDEDTVPDERQLCDGADSDFK